jgi:O-antigen/teichoic acid export membrane protein
MARSISIFSALAVSMILTRIISVQELGQYRTIWILYGVLGPVVTGSLSSLLYYRGSEESKRSESISIGLLLSSFLGVIMFLIVWLGFPWWETLFHAKGLYAAFRNFSVYMLFSGFSSVIESVFVLKHRNKWLFAHNLVSNALELSSIVIPFYLGYSLEIVTFCMISAPLLRSIFLIFFTKSDWTSVSWNQIKASLPVDIRYVGGLMLVSIAGIASINMDSWFVRWFYADDAIFAHYVIGARKIPFISALLNAAASALLIQLGKQFNEQKFKESFATIRMISSTLFSIIAPFLVLFLLFSEQLMQLLFGGFESSAPVFQVYLGTVVVHFLFSDTILLALGKSNLVFWASAVELAVNAILSVCFLYWIGFTGPAWATLIAHIVYILMCKFLADGQMPKSVPFSDYFSIKYAAKSFLVMAILIGMFFIQARYYQASVLVFISYLVVLLGIQFVIFKPQIIQLKSILSPVKEGVSVSDELT